MQEIIGAFLLAGVLSIVFGKLLLPILIRLRFGQQVRDDGPQTHLVKQNTPTMGGMIMIVSVIITTIIFIVFQKIKAIPISQNFVFISVLMMLGFGLIGFADDFLKIKKKNTDGLNAKQKLILQFVFALAVAIWAYFSPNVGSELIIPFTKSTVDLGWFYIPFVVFVVMGLVNAVNLTDGLDGLASSLMSIDSMVFSLIFVALVTQTMQSNPNTDLIINQGNMILFCAIFAGACFGFLWHNAYPARVFMGDMGSMALGGALSAMAILSRSILIIPVVGIMFVCSAVSVILQVGSYKLRNKKRIFLMAPLHHHYEKKGYHETRIVVGYVMITVACAGIALMGYFAK